MAEKADYREIINEYKDQIRILKDEVSELQDNCKAKDSALKRTTQKYENTLEDLAFFYIFPEEYKKMLAGLFRTFNLYVKLPDKYLPQIKIAEKDDDEGKQMLKELSKKITWHTSFETGAEC